MIAQQAKGLDPVGSELRQNPGMPGPAAFEVGRPEPGVAPRAVQVGPGRDDPRPTRRQLVHQLIIGVNELGEPFQGVRGDRRGLLGPGGSDQERRRVGIANPSKDVP